MANNCAVTRAEFDTARLKCRNWGRWGEDDELGRCSVAGQCGEELRSGSSSYFLLGHLSRLSNDHSRLNFLATSLSLETTSTTSHDTQAH